MTTTVSLFGQMAPWHYRSLPLFAVTGLLSAIEPHTLLPIQFPPDLAGWFSKKSVSLVGTVDVPISDHLQ